MSRSRAQFVVLARADYWRRRSFRIIATREMIPTAMPTTREAIRRCHSICSWKDVMRPSTGEAVPMRPLRANSMSMGGRIVPG